MKEAALIAAIAAFVTIVVGVPILAAAPAAELKITAGGCVLGAVAAYASVAIRLWFHD
jgi:hypothetical protein